MLDRVPFSIGAVGRDAAAVRARVLLAGAPAATYGHVASRRFEHFQIGKNRINACNISRTNESKSSHIILTCLGLRV